MTTVFLEIDFGNWQRFDIIFAGISAALLVVVIGIQIWTTRQAKEAARAAKISSDAAVDANRRSQEEMEIRLRPWMSLGWPEARDILISDQITPHEESVSMLVDITLLEERLKMTPSARVIFQVLVKNTGSTPAGDVNIFWKTSSDQLETWNAIFENAAIGSLVVGPGEALLGRFDEMPLETYVRYQNEETQPEYLGISATYSDPFGGCWIVGVEFLLTGQAIRQIQGATPQTFNEGLPTLAPPWHAVSASNPDRPD